MSLSGKFPGHIVGEAFFFNHLKSINSHLNSWDHNPFSLKPPTSLQDDLWTVGPRTTWTMWLWLSPIWKSWDSQRGLTFQQEKQDSQRWCSWGTLQIGRGKLVMDISDDIWICLRIWNWLSWQQVASTSFHDQSWSSSDHKICGHFATGYSGGLETPKR